MVFEVLAVESEDGLLVATDEKARRHIPARLALVKSWFQIEMRDILRDMSLISLPSWR